MINNTKNDREPFLRYKFSDYEVELRKGKAGNFEDLNLNKIQFTGPDQDGLRWGFYLFFKTDKIVYLSSYDKNKNWTHYKCPPWLTQAYMQGFKDGRQEEKEYPQKTIKIDGEDFNTSANIHYKFYG